MKSKIGAVLTRMHDKNHELKEIYSIIRKCRLSRNSHFFKIDASWYSAEDGFAKSVESAYFQPDNELKLCILDLMENYYEKRAAQCEEELKKMLEEMKQL